MAKAKRPRVTGAAVAPPAVRMLRSRDNIPTFLTDVEKLTGGDRGKLWSRAAQELRFLKNRKWFGPGGVPRRGYSEATLRVILRDYRNAVRLAHGDHPILRYLKTSILNQVTVKTRSTDATIAAQKDARPIDLEAITDRAIALLETHDDVSPFITAAALILVTGRRPVEILKTAHFHRIRKNAKADPLFPDDVPSLLFGGQVKTRGAAAATLEPYRIPVLADPDLILAALDTLRRNYDLADLSNVEVVDRTSKTLNKATRTFFMDDLGNTLGPKDLRGVYALIASEWCRPPAYQRNLYVGRILGHSERDVATSLSYMRFFEAGHRRDFDRDRRAAIRATIVAEREELKTTDSLERQQQVEQRIAEWRSALAKD